MFLNPNIAGQMPQTNPMAHLVGDVVPIRPGAMNYPDFSGSHIVPNTQAFIGHSMNSIRNPNVPDDVSNIVKLLRPSPDGK